MRPTADYIMCCINYNTVVAEINVSCQTAVHVFYSKEV